MDHMHKCMVPKDLHFIFFNECDLQNIVAQFGLFTYDNSSLQHLMLVVIATYAGWIITEVFLAKAWIWPRH